MCSVHVRLLVLDLMMMVLWCTWVGVVRRISLSLLFFYFFMESHSLYEVFSFSRDINSLYTYILDYWYYVQGTTACTHLFLYKIII